jgi:hypothetical protein
MKLGSNTFLVYYFLIITRFPCFDLISYIILIITGPYSISMEKF